MTNASNPAGSCIMVIFGAAGDLTKRLLIPALYNLARSKLLAKAFAIIGFARAQMSTEAFRTKLSQAMQDFVPDIDQETWDALVQRMHYVSGNFDDANACCQSSRCSDADECRRHEVLLR